MRRSASRHGQAVSVTDDRLSLSRRHCRRKGLLSFLAILMIAGILTALAPWLHGLWMERQARADVASFLELAAGLGTEDVFPGEEEEGQAPFPYPELYAAMAAYNEKIHTEHQSGLVDSASYAEPAFVLTDWGLETECFGIVGIPSLDIVMPLYLGASASALAMGAAQLGQTSIPIGGMDTNAVIAGHCSWKGANYFRYLSDIAIGDYVFVMNLWGTLVYQVRETAIIWPWDLDAILIQEGRDMVSLFTCWPYASGGRYRFVAYCERVPAPSPEVLALWDLDGYC